VTKRKAKHYSQVSIAYKIQRGRKQNNVASFAEGFQNSDRKANKSLSSLDDLGTTFQTGKQNKLSPVLMDYNISDRTGKTMSLSSLDGLQHFRQESKTISPKS
jgi:flagellar hook-basal body complex protein FliE